MFIGTCACTSLWIWVKVILDTHALAYHVLCLLFINMSFAAGGVAPWETAEA